MERRAREPPGVAGADPAAQPGRRARGPRRHSAGRPRDAAARDRGAPAVRFLHGGPPGDVRDDAAPVRPRRARRSHHAQRGASPRGSARVRRGARGARAPGGAGVDRRPPHLLCPDRPRHGGAARADPDVHADHRSGLRGEGGRPGPRRRCRASDLQPGRAATRGQRASDRQDPQEHLRVHRAPLRAQGARHRHRDRVREARPRDLGLPAVGRSRRSPGGSAWAICGSATSSRPWTAGARS